MSESSFEVRKGKQQTIGQEEAKGKTLSPILVHNMITTRRYTHACTLPFAVDDLARSARSNISNPGRYPRKLAKSSATRGTLPKEGRIKGGSAVVCSLFTLPKIYRLGTQIHCISVQWPSTKFSPLFVASRDTYPTSTCKRKPNHIPVKGLAKQLTKLPSYKVII